MSPAPRHSAVGHACSATPANVHVLADEFIAGAAPLQSRLPVSEYYLFVPDNTIWVDYAAMSRRYSWLGLGHEFDHFWPDDQRRAAPHTRRVLGSTVCPCVLHDDWGLQYDVMTNSGWSPPRLRP